MSGNHTTVCICLTKLTTGCPQIKLHGHCLISCNVKAIKSIAIKSRSLHSERTNLDFDI